MESPKVIIPKPRKKLRLFRITLGLILFLVGCFLFQLLGPNPTIVVGPETTVVDGPIQDDGFPDYLHCLQERAKSGVTKENNAGRLIAQALWPMGLKPTEQDAYLEALSLIHI